MVNHNWALGGIVQLGQCNLMQYGSSMMMTGFITAGQVSVWVDGSFPRHASSTNVLNLFLSQNLFCLEPQILFRPTLKFFPL